MVRPNTGQIYRIGKGLFTLPQLAIRRSAMFASRTFFRALIVIFRPPLTFAASSGPLFHGLRIKFLGAFFSDKAQFTRKAFRR